MANQYIYREVKEILNEEPILKEEFEVVRSSLTEFSYDVPKESFIKHYQEYEEFIEILVQLAKLPKGRGFKSYGN